MTHETDDRVKQRSGGFTLVELLVVVGVIAILISMLIPAIGKVREQAKFTSCRSNIRQIYTAINAYATDNDRFLPDAWYISERMWVGWTYAPFLHNKMKNYIAPRSNAYFCPGWPMDRSYNINATCSGTPDNPSAGNVPFTPENLGSGYYYICWASSFFNPGVRGAWTTENIRFGIPKNPTRAKILSCMNAQQDPLTSYIGPHQNGKLWNILWLDGSVTTSRGAWVTPSDGSLYVNSAGDWSQY